MMVNTVDISITELMTMSKRFESTKSLSQSVRGGSLAGSNYSIKSKIQLWVFSKSDNGVLSLCETKSDISCTEW